MKRQKDSLLKVTVIENEASTVTLQGLVFLQCSTSKSDAVGRIGKARWNRIKIKHLSNTMAMIKGRIWDLCDYKPQVLRQPGWEDGSVNKELATQVWRQELRSPELLQKSRRCVAHLWAQRMGGSDRGLLLSELALSSSVALNWETLRQWIRGREIKEISQYQSLSSISICTHMYSPHATQTQK